MRLRVLGGVAVLLTLALLMVACGGGSTTSTTTQPSSAQGSVYVTGSDAPLASVVGFQVTMTSLKLSDGTNTVEALGYPTTVDFARLLGLRTLLGLNQVNAGTYTSATVAIQDPVISYLDITSNPPAIKTMKGYFGTQGTTSTTVQLALNPNLVVGQNGLGGLHVHFNLHDSIEVVNGDFTGNVLPQIQLRALKPTDEDCHVDELLGGIVSIDTTNNQFVMQRWHGLDINVKVNNSTQWSGEGSNTWTLASLQQGYTVEVSGTVQSDRSILADSVEVVSIDKFFLGGLVLQAVPPTGTATNFTMFVRTEMPDVSGISVPGTATLNVSDQTKFDIRLFSLPIPANFLFDSSKMVVGQRIGVAGVINADNSLTLKRVALRRQGLEGKPLADTVQINGTKKEGAFQLQNNGMFGYIVGGTSIKVMTSQMTVFGANLPNALQDVQSMTSGRLVLWGLLLKDADGQPVYVAGYVNKVN